MKILTVIPARKGSKGVPGKNKKILAGKPLIEYSFEIASKLPDNFYNLVSTDDNEIIEISKNYEINFNGLRPKKLSDDDSLTIDVLKYELNETYKSTRISFDGILLLQPTCPFRKVDDILQSYEIFSQNNNSSVVSVCDVGANHPFRMKIIDDGKLLNFYDQGFEDMRPRQLLPNVYIRSGSIYMTSSENIRKGILVNDEVFPIITEGIYSINIDTLYDFYLAEKLFQDHKSSI